MLPCLNAKRLKRVRGGYCVLHSSLPSQPYDATGLNLGEQVIEIARDMIAHRRAGCLGPTGSDSVEDRIVLDVLLPWVIHDAG